ncbi:MAG: hypothetical protein IT430_18935 [Phycisphaerales bacterium]|nr:hypothetical protein [Phycisphaerales bacterium]
MPAFRDRTIRRRGTIQNPSQSRPAFQPLERRKLLSATPADIAAALDLPEGVVVTYEGHDDAIGVFENYTVEGLLGMPSGPNGQFVCISTAHAFDGVRTTDSGTRDMTTRYRDLGDEGSADDYATIRFTIDVPFSLVSQRLLIDFLYASDMDTDGGDFLDITVNGVNIAQSDGRGRIEAGGAYVVNERDPELDADVPGFGFEVGTEYTDLLTASYTIPGGVMTLDIEITIADSSDPMKDAWALIDNVRFEEPQVVYLDFDGHDIDDFFLSGTHYDVPEFDANDFGLGSNFADIIRGDMETLFADFNITFVTDEPIGGEFMRVVIGGRNSDTVTIDNNASTEWLLRPLNTSTTFGKLFNYVNFRNANGSQRSFGLADTLDLDNGNRGDTAVVFSDEIARFGEYDYDDLRNSIAHYIGRNLGLRAEDPDDTNAAGSIMNEDIDSRGDAFLDDDVNLLSIQWGDRVEGAEVMRQNAHEVLLDLLGSTTGDPGIFRARTDIAKMNEAHWTIAQPTRGKLFDAQFIVIGDQHTRTTRTFVDEWESNQVLVTDYAGGDPQIVITAASRDGGAITFETYGPRNLGQFTQVNSDAPIVLISLFEEIGTTPVFRGTATVIRTEVADTTVYYSSYEFESADGDLITISFNSRTGLFAVEETDGGLVITLGESDASRDTLTINVKRRGDGDGLATISGIMGSGLRTLKVLRTDIDGAGVDLDSLRTGRFESIMGGTNFNIRQDEGVAGDIRFDMIGGDSRFIVGRQARKFMADDITGGTYSFGELVRFDARGDMAVQRLDIEDGDRAVIKVIGDAIGGVWTVWTETDKHESWKTIDVRGAVIGVSIEAPGRISRVKVRENFDGDIDARAFTSAVLRGDATGSILLREDGSHFHQASKSVKVLGAARNLLVQSQDSINLIQLGAAIDSNFYVGFDLAVNSGLVVDPSLIVNEDARVKTLKIRGLRDELFDVVNSFFCAVTFGKVTLGDIDGDNGGTAFGLAARSVDRITFDTGTGRVTNKGETWFLDNDNSDDFLLGRII